MVNNLGKGTIRPKQVLSVLLCAIVLISMYWGAVDFDFVNWDDQLYVVNAPTVLMEDGTPFSDYFLTPQLGYPALLTNFTFLVQYRFHGMNPYWFHLGNLCLAVLFVVVYSTFLLRLGLGPLFVTVATLLTILHPITVEAIVWISGRKDLLAAVFGFSFLHCCIGSERKICFPEGRLAFLAALFYLGSFLAKPTLVLLPLVPLFGQDQVDKTGFFRISWRKIALWYCIVGLIIVPLILIGIKNQRILGAIPTVSMIEGITIALRSLYHHLEMLIAPIDLLPKVILPQSIPTEELVVPLLTIFLYFLIFYKEKKRTMKAILLFIALTYLPSSGLIPLTRQIGASYALFPLLGIGWFIAHQCNRIEGMIPDRYGVLYLSVLFTTSLLVLTGLATINRNYQQIWRDGQTLWSHESKKYPDSPQVCRNLGNAYIFGRRMQPDNAVKTYIACTNLTGSFDFVRKNLAIALLMSGKLSEAKNHFVLLQKNDPRTSRKYLDFIDRLERKIAPLP